MSVPRRGVPGSLTSAPDGLAVQGRYDILPITDNMEWVTAGYGEVPKGRRPVEGVRQPSQAFFRAGFADQRRSFRASNQTASTCTTRSRLSTAYKSRARVGSILYVHFRSTERVSASLTSSFDGSRTARRQFSLERRRDGLRVRIQHPLLEVTPASPPSTRRIVLSSFPPSLLRLLSPSLVHPTRARKVSQLSHVSLFHRVVNRRRHRSSCGSSAACHGPEAGSCAQALCRVRGRPGSLVPSLKRDYLEHLAMSSGSGDSLPRLAHRLQRCLLRCGGTRRSAKTSLMTATCPPTTRQ